MRRWTLLLAGAALWLFLAAVPALADGGPHVAANNSGTSTLTADSCAGCHRAHTAQGPMLINQPTEEALCLSCHGATGTGATTNVEDGVQYGMASSGLRDGTVVAGALRAGGFVNARIAASGPLTRVPYPRDSDRNTTGVQVVASFSEYVPVLANGQAVTSAHMHVGTSGFTAQNKAWGNGATSPTANAGPTVTLECATCHNPHGNGQYRILNTVPSPTAATGSTFSAASAAVQVPEVRTNPAGAGAAAIRNYTVKWGATLADVVASTYPNAASPDGDYWRLYQPYTGVPTWDGTSATITAATGSGDIAEFTGGANAGALVASSAWRSSISSWCATCHTRYHTAGVTGLAQTQDSGDAIFKYRHGTVNRECTQCHVSHGSNAAMTGTYSANYTYPDGTASASSRLLKVANRGTCQACHDPTGTILWNASPITH
ncbi:MAG: cytochrome c3 family protein [Chloroflexi bacterium]|nr:cytochrome c3 family protein [Chloroflexota bacterium]